MCYCLWYNVLLPVIHCVIACDTLCYYLWYIVLLLVIICVFTCDTLCFYLWYIVLLPVILFVFTCDTLCYCLWYNVLLPAIHCVFACDTLCFYLWYIVLLPVILCVFTCDTLCFYLWYIVLLPVIHVTSVILSGQNWSRRSYLQTPRRWVSDIASFTHALKPSHDVVLVIYLCNHVNKILCDERTRLSAELLAGWTVFCRLYCNNGVVFALNTVQNSNYLFDNNYQTSHTYN